MSFRGFFKVFAFFIIHLYSQDYIDIATVGGVHSPNNVQENSSKKVDVSETYLNLKLPLVLKNKDIFLIGFNGGSLSFHDHYDPLHSDKFYSGSLLLGYTKKWSDKFQTLFLAIPKMSSDFKDITNKDYQMGGILLFTFTKNDHFKYKLGAYYNQEYFGPLVLPIFGIDWKPTDKVSVFGNLPINLTIDRKLSKRFSSGFYFQAINMSYRLGQVYQHQYLQKYSLDFSLYLDTYIAKNIVFTIKGGHSLSRELNFFNDGEKHKLRSMFLSIGERQPPLNKALANGLLLEARLAFRVFTNKSEKTPQDDSQE